MPKPKLHFLLLFSFALALFLGLALGAVFISQQVSVVEDSGSLLNVGFFFLYIIFATGLMLIVLHFYRGKKLFFFAELLLEFSTIQILLSLFLSEFYSLALALAAVALRVVKSDLKQPLLFVASVTVGALLGSSLDFIPAVLLSLLLAAYDYFAVFKSKHMVTLAKELQKREAAFAIEFRAKKTPEQNENAVTAGAGGKAKKTAQQNAEPEKDFESILLGTGDFVVPIMLIVSILKISMFGSIAAAVGALVGLSSLLYVMQKTRGYYPALPPIVLFSVLFYSATLLI